MNAHEAPQKFPKEKVFLYHQAVLKLFTRTERQTGIHSQAKVLNNDIENSSAPWKAKKFRLDKADRLPDKLGNKVDNKDNPENLPCAIVL